MADPWCDYLVKELLGEGSFGCVLLCKKQSTQKEVALKVMKIIKHEDQSTTNEMEILQRLKVLGSEEHHIVRFMGGFEFEGRICLEFESLDMDLRHFIIQSENLSLRQIQIILRQLTTALSFLQKCDIIHGDLKPENVLMVNHSSSLQVKVIDFGLAQSVHNATTGTIIQSRWYRAPEVFLGADYDESADVWSLGCMAVEMLVRRPLFPGCSSADSISQIVQTVGTPPINVLERGKYTKKYFNRQNISGTPRWTLKTLNPGATMGNMAIHSLRDLYPMERPVSKELQFFVDLVMQMLVLDPLSRIRAADVLLHPFLSLSHTLSLFHTEQETLSNQSKNSETLPEDVPLHPSPFVSSSVQESPKFPLNPWDVPLPDGDDWPSPHLQSSDQKEPPKAPLHPWDVPLPDEEDWPPSPSRIHVTPSVKDIQSQKLPTLPEDVPLPNEDNWLLSFFDRPVQRALWRRRSKVKKWTSESRTWLQRQ